MLKRTALPAAKTFALPRSTGLLKFSWVTKPLKLLPATSMLPLGSNAMVFRFCRLDIGMRYGVAGDDAGIFTTALLPLGKVARTKRSPAGSSATPDGPDRLKDPTLTGWAVPPVAGTL